MEKALKNDMMKAQYESPSMVEIQISCEGVLCQSGVDGIGTEPLEELLGEW